MLLKDACESMTDELREEYGLGPGDALYLFEAIWETMTRNPKDSDLNNAINKVEDDLGIT